MVLTAHYIIGRISAILSRYISNRMLLFIAVSAVLSILITLAVIVIGRIIDIARYSILYLLAWIFGADRVLTFVNFVTFPGVVVHELSHAIFIEAAGGEVTEIRFLDPRDEDRRLGYVDFTPQGSVPQAGLQIALGSCAPVIVGVIAQCLIYYFMFNYPHNLLVKILFIYLSFSIGFHMTMSREDVKHYIQGILMIFPLILAIVCIIRLEYLHI